MILKFDGWPRKTKRAPLLYYVELWRRLICLWRRVSLLNKCNPIQSISSFVHHFIAISEFKLKLQSRNPQFGSKSAIFVLCDLEIWWMTLKNNRAPLLFCFKLCASFQGHGWIQTGATVRKHPFWVKICDFFSRVTLKFGGWPWKTIGHLS